MELDLQDLGISIANQFRDLQIPPKVDLVTETKNNWIIQLNDIIFKIAKHEIAHKQNSKERNILLQYQGQLGNVQIPYPMYYFSSADIPYGSIGYRKLPGTLPTRDVIETTGTRYAENLAYFLNQLHNQHTAISDEIGVSLYPPSAGELDRILVDVNSYLESQLKNKEYETVLEFEKNLQIYYQNYQYQPVLIHGDLWYQNQLIEPSTGQLLGILDFGNLSLGDPLVDIAVQEYISSEFMEDVFNAFIRYNPLYKDIDIRKHAYFILGLRELLTLNKELRTGYFDKDTIPKIHRYVINSAIRTN